MRTIAAMYICLLATGLEAQTTEQKFHTSVEAFAKAAETYISSVGVKHISESEKLGKKALEVWGHIPSPTQEFPNTRDVKRVRVPTNNLAKLIGGQVLDIASDGYIPAERVQKALAQSQLNVLKRELGK